MKTQSSITSANCLNCGADTTARYCGECGQLATPGRITFAETLSQFLSAYFSFQGPLVRTMRLLVLNPGKVFRDVIAGKRKAYYQPVSFFVLLSAVYILIRVAIDYDPLTGQAVVEGENNVAKFQNKGYEAARFMVNNINYIMFFLVFSIGLSLKLFFRKRYNLAEYTFIGFYISGLYVITGIVTMLISYSLGAPTGSGQLLMLIAWICYCTWSLIDRLTLWLAVKYLLASLLSLFLYLLMGYGFSLLVVYLRT